MGGSTSQEQARELAQELWGSELDEEAMRYDGLDPVVDGFTFGADIYRQKISRDSEEDRITKGFRREIKDYPGRAIDLGEPFTSPEVYEEFVLE